MADDKSDISLPLEKGQDPDRTNVEGLVHINSAEELGLGALLVQHNMITQEQLDEAIQRQADAGYEERLGSFLIASKLISEEQLLQLIAQQLGLPYIQFIADREIPDELIKKVPMRFAKKFQILPISYMTAEAAQRQEHVFEEETELGTERTSFVIAKERLKTATDSSDKDAERTDKTPITDIMGKETTVGDSEEVTDRKSITEIKEQEDSTEKTADDDKEKEKSGDKMQYVQVVTADPLNSAVIDDIRLLLEHPVKVAAAPSSLIIEAINRCYDRASSADEAIHEFGTEDIEEGGFDEPVDLLDSEDEAPIIRLVNSLLYRAVKDRASDLHVEPYEKEVAVRFRIDGDLYDIMKIPKRLQNSITSRIKLIGSLNIAEKRLPQDGRIRIKIAGKDIDIRLSTVPTSHGERIVLRLLDKSNVVLDLEKLGFAPAMLKKMTELISKPHGIILVTGPTGSGKTTTLYAALTQINKEDINIITVEDPVEYQLKGIGQIQVNDKVGLTFANGLRSVLRQDPDVVLIGEIRDKETAEIAVQASLTGHLVLSTIHTNDAAASIARLVDMGVEPFLVSSSLIGILAQRLVRRVCQYCRKPHKPSPEELSRLGVEKIPEQARIYKSNGCERCFRTGYTGRIGIFELLPVDDELRSVILKSSDAISLKKAAIAKGFKPMRFDGLRKILEGQTTIEEVLSTTQEDTVVEF